VTQLLRSLTYSILFSSPIVDRDPLGGGADITRCHMCIAVFITISQSFNFWKVQYT